MINEENLTFATAVPRFSHRLDRAQIGFPTSNGELGSDPTGLTPDFAFVVKTQLTAALRYEQHGMLRMQAMPTLILPAIQVNINAGKLPEPEENGVRYLKIPLDAL